MTTSKKGMGTIESRDSKRNWEQSTFLTLPKRETSPEKSIWLQWFLLSLSLFSSHSSCLSFVSVCDQREWRANRILHHYRHLRGNDRRRGLSRDTEKGQEKWDRLVHQHSHNQMHESKCSSSHFFEQLQVQLLSLRLILSFISSAT